MQSTADDRRPIAANNIFINVYLMLTYVLSQLRVHVHSTTRQRYGFSPETTQRQGSADAL